MISSSWLIPVTCGEGVLPEEIQDTIQSILPLQGIHLKGMGVNFNCVSGIEPTIVNEMELVTLSQKIEKELNINIEILSGGATSSLVLVTQYTIPKGINQLRIGKNGVKPCNLILLRSSGSNTPPLAAFV